MKAVNHACSVFLRGVILRMKELGLNHTTLAERMHVSRPYIAKVLSGDVNISFGTALKFAKALKMDFSPVLRQRGEAVETASVMAPEDRTAAAYRKVHLAVAGIERGARLMGISGREMHDRLKAKDLISRFLFGQYEPLHTQCYDYVAEASVEALKNWEMSAQ